MQFEVGKIYDGVVKGITPYGAFVELDKNTTGMVHISEIAHTYVNNIREHLTENQQVKVMILGFNDAGKISLSIKKATPKQQSDSPNNKHYSSNEKSNGSEHRSPSNKNKLPGVWESKSHPSQDLSFEEMMSKFKQSSEEKMCDLKRSLDNKRKNSSRRGK